MEVWLKVKDDVDLKRLRQYGFKPGNEWKDERFLNGCDYMLPWWHKCSMDPDNPECVYYSDDDYDQPMVHICIRDDRTIYADLTPECTYHVGGSELSVLMETVYDMVRDGILEKERIYNL